MQAPVEQGGLTLYFQSFNPRTTALNWRATKLFGRTGFYIHGPALLGASDKTWHCLRVLGDEQSIRAQIAHLTLGDHAIWPTSRRDTHQDIIVRDEQDFYLVKMALS